MNQQDLKAVVDQLQTVVEGLLPWMKDDFSSSGSSNPRTPTPDVELEEILECEANAQRSPTLEPMSEIFEFREPEQEQLDEDEEAAYLCPDLERLNEIFEFRDPEPEKLNEMFEFEEAAQADPELEQLDPGFSGY